MKIAAPPGFKVPGALWVVGLVVIFYLSNTYITDPRWLYIVVTIIGLVLPLVVDNDGQLKIAKSIIQLLTQTTTISQPELTRSVRAPEPVVIQQPKVGHPVMRYLFG